MKVLFLFLCFLFVSCKISYDEWMDPGASISTSDSTFEEQNCHVDNDCSLIPGRYIHYFQKLIFSRIYY